MTGKVGEFRYRKPVGTVNFGFLPEMSTILPHDKSVQLSAEAKCNFYQFV